MSTQDFITELFCRVDDAMHDIPKHNQASLYPSEVVTLALLFAIKGVGNRAFYRWAKRDCLPLFPALPERTRLFRLFAAHQGWSNHFMAQLHGTAHRAGSGRYLRDRALAPMEVRENTQPNRAQRLFQPQMDSGRQALYAPQQVGVGIGCAGCRLGLCHC